jgi:hypothetical protein
MTLREKRAELYRKADLALKAGDSDLQAYYLNLSVRVFFRCKAIWLQRKLKMLDLHERLHAELPPKDRGKMLVALANARAIYVEWGGKSEV